MRHVVPGNDWNLTAWFYNSNESAGIAESKSFNYLILIRFFFFTEILPLFKETRERSSHEIISQHCILRLLRTLSNCFLFFLPELNFPSNKTTNALKQRNDLPQSRNFRLKSPGLIQLL